MLEHPCPKFYHEILAIIDHLKACPQLSGAFYLQFYLAFVLPQHLQSLLRHAQLLGLPLTHKLALFNAVACDFRERSGLEIGEYIHRCEAEPQEFGEDW
jgi:hypothetical protein